MTYSPLLDFQSQFDIVGCYVEYEENVIILKRQPHKPQGNQYGLPAGKVVQNESLAEAMSRELREETGIRVPPNNLTFLKSFPTKYPDADFMFHVFKVILTKKPEIILNPLEHSEYRFITPREVLTFPSIMEQVPAYTRELYSLSSL